MKIILMDDRQHKGWYILSVAVTLFVVQTEQCAAHIIWCDHWFEHKNILDTPLQHSHGKSLPLVDWKANLFLQSHQLTRPFVDVVVRRTIAMEHKITKISHNTRSRASCWMWLFWNVPEIQYPKVFWVDIDNVLKTWNCSLFRRKKK